MRKILVVLIIIITSTFITGCEEKSSYELAVLDGYEGTKEEYLDALNGVNSNDLSLEDIFQSLVDRGEYEYDEYTLFISDYLNYTVNVEEESYSLDVIMNNTLNQTVSITTVYQRSSGAGSGVLYNTNISDGSGYIITNFHVVADTDNNNKLGSTFYINYYSQEYEQYSKEVKYVGAMPEYDIAVLYVENCEMIKNGLVESVEIDESKIYAGDFIYAVGNALGEGTSITQGIISVESEYITLSNQDYRVMRIDADINQGNSGGGLFNSDGKLAGIINAKVISEEVEGFGYALPIASVSGIVENIIYNNSNVVKATLGISVTSNDSIFKYDEFEHKYYIDEVVSVESVSTTSVALGVLEVGDIILSAKLKDVTYEITRTFNLSDILFKANYNDVLELKIIRGDEVLYKPINLTNFNYY